MASRLPPGASRVFHRAIDGTIPYFRSEDGMQEEGRLPEGADPAELLGDGYVEADRDSFLEARTRLDPMRPIPARAREVNVHVPGGKVRMDPADADAYGAEVDAAYEARTAEDAALDELAGAVSASGLGRQQSSPMAARTAPARRPIPRGSTPADVDALGSVWDDFHSRAKTVDVERVPSSVALASRMGGEPLPSPQQAPPRPPPQAMASRESPAPVPDSAPELDSLEGAQRRAAIMRGIAGMSRGSSRIGAALAGTQMQEGAAADLDQNAEAQVREYLQRRQQGEAEKASAEQAAFKDPTSPASQRFQAMVSRAFGSVYTPEQIRQMTASDAPLVGKYGEMVRTLEDRAAGRTADMEAQQAQHTARATEAEKQRAFEGKQNAANRANAREIAGMRQPSNDKASIAEQNWERKLTERGVGGFEFDPANPPSADGAKKMAEVAAARDKMLNSLRRMEETFSRVGTEWGGKNASTMETEWKNITDEMRKISDMGVPNGRDYEMLAKQIPDPVGPTAMVTRNSTIAAKFPALRQQIADMVDATAKAYKFRPAGGAQAGAQPTASATPRRKRDAQGRMWEEGPDGEMRMVL